MPPPRPRLALRRPPALRSPAGAPPRRWLSSAAPPAGAPADTPALPPAPPPRWLSELRARVGRCLMFGCSPAQVGRAAVVLRAVATEWRELVAGSEGFLTGGRGGLEGHRVAWGEMDSYQHVNNVHYLRYAETARVNWVTNFAVHVDPAHRREWSELMTPRSIGLIMRSIKVEYKFPMTYPDSISVYHRLRAPPAPAGDPGAASLALDCVVLSHAHRRPAARLEEDVVVYDYRAVAPAAEMPGFLRAGLEAAHRLQRGAAARARARAWELTGLVEALERETWDREGAVEDLGAAAGAPPRS